MAYVPSHLEHCPFWINKTDNLETECTVPPPPGATDDFYYYVFDQSPENFIIDTDGSLLLGISNPIGLLTMQNEGIPALTCDQSAYNLDRGRVYLVGSNYTRCPNLSYSGHLSTFSKSSCVATENPDSINQVFEDVIGWSGFPQSMLPAIGDINNNCVMGMIISENSDTHILRSLDGITWVEEFQYTSSGTNCLGAFILPNLKPAVGGFLAISYDATSSSNCSCVTSDINGQNWINRGSTTYNNDYVFMYYDDKVISLSRLDNWYLYLANNHGTSPGHEMVPPDYWGVGYTWDYFDISGLFTVDPTTETLFTTFRFWDATDGYKLFKSTDWGLTWDFISDLKPVNYPSNYYDVEVTDDEASYGSSYMQVRNGYLTLLDTVFGAIYQFKLSDIL